MVFVNEEFSVQDKERYHFTDFEKKYVSSANPDPFYWVIDRDTETFLRKVKPVVGDTFDPESHKKNQFHFHRHGYDYLVQVRKYLSENNLAAFPGTRFISGRTPQPGSTQQLYYLRSISEKNRPSPEAPCALRQEQQAVLSDLEAALSASFGGNYMYLPQQDRETPEEIHLIIAPDALHYNDGGSHD